MTPDQLRQGAALVRCLVEGDESARGPLSDFVEEFGLPNLITLFPALHICRTIDAIREGWSVYKLDRDRRDGVELLSPRICNGNIWYRIGAWPRWAWEGREPTSEAS